MTDEVATRLWHVVQALERVATFTIGKTSADYVADPLLRSAVERQMQIAGEALAVIRKLRPDLASRITDISKVIGMRNILVHGYAQIDDLTIWDVAINHAPNLRQAVQQLRAETD